MSRKGYFLVLTLCAMALASARGARAEEDLAARAARIEAMPADQKARLAQKQERYDALSDKERDRLRTLHNSIESQPNSKQLYESLKRYSEWLKTLSAAEQAAVMKLPIDKRLEQIKAIRQEQIQQHFAELAWQLEKEDLDTINGWMADFVARHESDILANMHSQWAERAISASDPKEREAILITAVFGFPRSRNSRLPLPTQADFAALELQLSQKLRAELAMHTDENRRDLVMACARFAHFSRFAPPPPSDDQLRRFYATLDASKRERLDKLDRQQMKRELTREYFRQPIRRGQGGPRGGPSEGGPLPPPGRGPGPP